MIIDFKLPPEPYSISSTSSSIRSSYCYTTLYFSLAVTAFCILFLSFSFLHLVLFPSISVMDRQVNSPDLFWHPPLIHMQSHQKQSWDFLIAQWLLMDERPRWTRERLMRRLPQCIIIGVRKSGTRAIIEFLHLHPRIKKASDEMHFFDEEQNYQKGLEWYRRSMPYSYYDQITVEKKSGIFYYTLCTAKDQINECGYCFNSSGEKPCYEGYFRLYTNSNQSYSERKKIPEFRGDSFNR